MAPRTTPDRFGRPRPWSDAFAMTVKRESINTSRPWQLHHVEIPGAFAKLLVKQTLHLHFVPQILNQLSWPLIALKQ